ncbi:hypothetical protein M670_00476 [Schinkia azotoformans MEV2011]|uniref:DUF6906 domain-containing protein n=1 Tax=Schinkia azotoformans MEV2011 TaxID=1348973 RepID=A0A072P4N8_SCHAZ|nr:hypothetical protein [Schinkia azotoformans]KEF40450.1 hypothetical protein M670_00476 [Schinkia azotoformans MEV2011]MEC1696140.1 hypothetical protein [Schinkia azotoformans]MEC1716645.1 hypothetical protein [Schinkia azotoformans]MEC1725357.1 hypothetical protein [Schinkia azotoformans]MEC1739484.1 hypothetical protein [Schinkia azotoformans]
MKKGLRPTKRQKIAIQAARLNCNNWLVYKNTNSQLHLVHRETGTTRVIPG